MVRRTNIIMALDGILYDVRQRTTTGYTPEQNGIFMEERIMSLRKHLDQEERYLASERVKRQAA